MHFFNCQTVKLSKTDYLLLKQLLLYEAIESFLEFEADADRVVGDVEAAMVGQAFEVKVEGAVVASGDGDVAPIEDVGVALADGHRRDLDEGEVVVVVAVDDARVVLAQQGAAVVTEISFQVDAEVGVGIASRISFFHFL